MLSKCFNTFVLWGIWWHYHHSWWKIQTSCKFVRSVIAAITLLLTKIIKTYSNIWRPGADSPYENILIGKVAKTWSTHQNIINVIYNLLSKGDTTLRFLRLTILSQVIIVMSSYFKVKYFALYKTYSIQTNWQIYTFIV